MPVSTTKLVLKAISLLWIYRKEIVRFIQALEKGAKRYESREDLKEKLNAVTTAFETGDADLINSVINGELLNGKTEST